MNYSTTQHTEVLTVEKTTWTKKLNDFGDYDQQRVYYYRQKCLNDHIKGWHCVDCKRELTIFNNKGEYGYRYEPYRIHQVFIKKQAVNHTGKWNRGKKQEVSYFNALCCKCWEKRKHSVLVEKTATSETFELEPNKCDCQEYLNEQITKQELTIKEIEKQLLTHLHLKNWLEGKQGLYVNTKAEIKEHLDIKVDEYQEKEKQEIANLEEHLNEEKKQLNKFTNQLEQVKYLLGINL